MFGAFKLMMEMAEVANKISDCEKWRSDNAKLLVDNFRSIDKAIIKDLQEKKLPENDPIVSHILARQEEMYHILALNPHRSRRQLLLEILTQSNMTVLCHRPRDWRALKT